MDADERGAGRARARSAGTAAHAWGRWAMALLLAAGCAHAPPGTGSAARRGEGVRTPPPAEQHSAEYLKGKEIGRQFVSQALKEFRFHTEWEVAGAVSRVGRRLVKATGADPDTYHFFVVENPQANAFAIPGGYIFVFDGLLRRLDSEDELAGVLAHEIGHVRYGHFFKNQKQLAAADLAVLAAVLLGQGGEAVTAFSIAGAASLQLSYSRDNEREADQSALDTLPKAGYDPRGLPRFFGVLAREEHLLLPENKFPYLATHPGLEERMHRAEEMVDQSGVAPPPPRPRALWERLSGTLEADDVARRPPTGGPYPEGLAYLKASRFAEALPLLTRAVTEDPVSVDALTALGECRLAMGNLKAAHDSARTALALDAKDAPAHLLAGELARREGDTATAINELRHAVVLAPDHPMAHFRLSQLLDATGDKDEAQFHLARYLRLTLHPDEAYATLQAILAGAEPALATVVKREMQSLKEEGV